MVNPVRTNVYVDGFNFYYGSVKGTPYKWVNLEKLCHLLLPRHEINRIRYFTALVSARPSDPQQPQRQQTYLRALRTISNLSIHYGHFLTNIKRLPLANPLPEGPRTVEVLDTEEKGSDVNLATYLMIDGLNKDYELAAIITNDSDLALPIQYVRDEFKLTVGFMNSHPVENRSKALLRVTTFYKKIRLGALKASQFPDRLTDVHGTITKPSGW